MKKEGVHLSILMILSLFLSIYLFFHTHVISLDGAFQYIPIAKEFTKGLYQKAIANTQQPLYSLFIAFLYQWIPDFETSGRLITSFFGILLIFPVYFLGKWMYDRNIAFLSTLLICVHPYIRRFSADVLKESTYLFFLTTAVCISWKAIEERNKYFYILVSVLTAISYLIRPDGMEVITSLLIFLLFIKKFDRVKEKTIPLFILIFTFLLFLLPYLIFLKEVKGEWVWNNAKSLTVLLGLKGGGEGPPLIEKMIFSFKKLNSEIFSIFHPIYLFLLFIGIVKRFPSPLKENEKYILIFIVTHYIILFLLILNFTDWGLAPAEITWMFSGRHTLPLLIFTIYWAGDGLNEIYQWLMKKFERSRSTFRFQGKMIGIFSMFLIFALVIPKTLKPQRYERIHEKWAGIWIKNNFGNGAQILTTLPRVAYYADGRLKLINLKLENLESTPLDLRSPKELFLVLRESEALSMKEELKKSHFRELKRFENDGMERIVLYKKTRP